MAQALGFGARRPLGAGARADDEPDPALGRSGLDGREDAALAGIDLGQRRRDVWVAAACDTILHWDGVEWRTVREESCDFSTRHLNGVCGTGPDDVWAVGEDGRILHWDGSVWTPEASGTPRRLSAVWATGGGEVWAVGDSGVILRRPVGE